AAGGCASGSGGACSARWRGRPRSGCRFSVSPADEGLRGFHVTGVQTWALAICRAGPRRPRTRRAEGNPMTPARSWLRRFQPRPGARIRLVCLPHAGGGANAYRSWAALLPPGVDLVCVQYPGREDRLAEAPVDDMAAAVGAIARELAPLLDRPYALFGHSMGSAVGYELARRLRDEGRPEPERLFASGRRAPADAPPGRVHLAADEEII